jgi:hypothetical protein
MLGSFFFAERLGLHGYGTTTEPMRENSVNFLFLGALSSVKEDNLLITAEPRNPVNN